MKSTFWCAPMGAMEPILKSSVISNEKTFVEKETHPNEFQYTDGSNPDFIALCHQLDDFLNQLVGGEQNRAQYLPYNTLEDIHHVVLLWDGERAIGCAAFKEYDRERAEVQAGFSLPGVPGKGLGQTTFRNPGSFAPTKGIRLFDLGIRRTFDCRHETLSVYGL